VFAAPTTDRNKGAALSRVSAPPQKRPRFLASRPPTRPGSIGGYSPPAAIRAIRTCGHRFAGANGISVPRATIASAPAFRAVPGLSNPQGIEGFELFTRRMAPEVVNLECVPRAGPLAPPHASLTRRTTEWSSRLPGWGLAAIVPENPPVGSNLRPSWKPGQRISRRGRPIDLASW